MDLVNNVNEGLSSSAAKLAMDAAPSAPSYTDMQGQAMDEDAGYLPSHNVEENYKTRGTRRPTHHTSSAPSAPIPEAVTVVSATVVQEQGEGVAPYVTASKLWLWLGIVLLLASLASFSAMLGLKAPEEDLTPLPEYCTQFYKEPWSPPPLPGSKLLRFLSSSSPSLRGSLSSPSSPSLRGSLSSPSSPWTSTSSKTSQRRLSSIGTPNTSEPANVLIDCLPKNQKRRRNDHRPPCIGGSGSSEYESSSEDEETVKISKAAKAAARVQQMRTECDGLNTVLQLHKEKQAVAVQSKDSALYAGLVFACMFVVWLLSSGLMKWFHVDQGGKQKVDKPEEQVAQPASEEDEVKGEITVI